MTFKDIFLFKSSAYKKNKHSLILNISTTFFVILLYNNALYYSIYMEIFNYFFMSLCTIVIFFRYNLKKSYFDQHYWCPIFSIKSDYEASGQIGNVTVKGSGKSLISYCEWHFILYFRKYLYSKYTNNNKWIKVQHAVFVEDFNLKCDGKSSRGHPPFIHSYGKIMIKARPSFSNFGIF